MDETAELRREIEGRRRRSRFSPELAARIRAHVAERRAGGATMYALAEELGIALDTLYRWQRGVPAFRAVEVVSPAASVSLVVHGPRGLRIEGLDVDSVAELWRRLG